MNTRPFGSVAPVTNTSYVSPRDLNNKAPLVEAVKGKFNTVAEKLSPTGVDAQRSLAGALRNAINSSHSVRLAISEEFLSQLPSDCGISNLFLSFIEQVSVCIQDSSIKCDAEELHNAFIEGFIKIIFDQPASYLDAFVIEPAILVSIRDNLKQGLFKDLDTTFFSDLLLICKHKRPRSTNSSMAAQSLTKSAKGLVKFASGKKTIERPFADLYVKQLGEYLVGQIKINSCITKICSAISQSDDANVAKLVEILVQIKDALGQIRMLGDDGLLSMPVVLKSLEFVEKNKTLLKQHANGDLEIVVELLYSCISRRLIAEKSAVSERDISQFRRLNAFSFISPHSKYAAIYDELMKVLPDSLAMQTFNYYVAGFRSEILKQHSILVDADISAKLDGYCNDFGAQSHIVSTILRYTQRKIYRVTQLEGITTRAVILYNEILPYGGNPQDVKPPSTADNKPAVNQEPKRRTTATAAKPNGNLPPQEAQL